jgi:hypothetical protein
MRSSRFLATVLLSAVVVAPVYGRQPRLDLRSFVGTWTEDVTQRRAVTSGLTYAFSQEPDGLITIVRAGVDLRDRVRFDGKDYETAGVPGRTVSWIKVSDTTYETTVKRDGALVAKGRWILSEGGKRLTQETTPGRVDEKIVTNVSEYVRISGEGNSLIGEWKPIASQSPEADQFVLSVIDETTLKMLYPRNQRTITISLDGKEYPATGPNSLPGMTSSAEAIDARSLRRTTLREHKPLFETVMTVSSDGKRLTVTSRTIGTTDVPAVFVYNKED